MKKTKPLTIPYNLETQDEILEAMNTNFMNIGSGYSTMLAFAQKNLIQKPPALLQAKKYGEKVFYKLQKEKIKLSNVKYTEVAHLDFVQNFSIIENTIPWARMVAQYDNFFSFLDHCPESVQKECSIRSSLCSLESLLAVRELLREEMIAYARSKKTKKIDIEALRQILVAYAIHAPGNEDICVALKKIESKSGANGTLYENASAELLFNRLPNFMHELITLNPRAIRRKLFSKIAKLNLTKKQQVNLFGYFKPNTQPQDVIKTLDKIDSIARKTTISEQSKMKLHDYIKSLKFNIETAKTLYRTWYLAPETETMQKLYIPQLIMKETRSYKEFILHTYTHATTLTFYPTKDYLDLYKSKFSSDCTNNEMAENQLLVPHFFNIRIFLNSEWIGNIYMLDFSREFGIIIVDRIQIPILINVEYINFFECLREMFKDLFADVDYKEILLPLTISNHGTIQKVFNNYKQNLPKKDFQITSPYTKYFESLQGKRIFYVL